MPEPSAPSRAHAPARRRRWPAVLLVVLAALAAGWWWGVPYLVGTMLKTQLRAAGFPDAQVGTVAVAFDRIEVLGLRFGNGSIGSIDVPVATATFRAGDLFGARIDTLVLERPVWSLAPKATGPADVVAAEREVQRALPELPLRRLEVHDARITPAAASGFGAGAIDVTFTADGPRWQLVAAADVGEHRLRATAQLLVGATLASGDVEVQVVGPRPLVLAGPCRVELLSAERVLDLELARAADPFDVALGDRGWTGSGGVALRARVPAGHLDAARVEVALDEFSFGATGGLQVDGLSGDVVLTGLPRPVSDGPQLLRWQGLRFAKIQAGSGEARLELRHDLELSAHVRQMASDEVGSIEVRGVRLAPGVSSLPATIAFDRVSLQEWLELLSKGRVTGDGRLTGSVDVVVHTEPQLELDLQGGEVSAVEGGLVRFLEDRETKQMIREYAEQVAASSGHGNVVKERIVGALEEFEYSELGFRIEREPDGSGVTLAVHAAGQGRKVPQQLTLDVNLHGFDAAVDTALAFKLGFDRAKQRLDDKIEGNQTTPNSTGQR